MRPVVELEGIDKVYGTDLRVLKGIDLCIV